MSLNRSFRKTLLILVFGCVAACYCAYRLPAGQKIAPWAEELSAWRTQHATDLQKPDGWLSLAGLVWLEPGDNAVGSASDNKVRLPASGPAHAGVLHVEGGTVSLRPPAGGFPDGLQVDGKPAKAQELHTRRTTTSEIRG